jgi:hypothetical protein
MNSKEALLKKLDRCTKRSNRLYLLKQNNDKMMWQTKKQLAEVEFGKIGSKISFHYNGKIIKAEIISFQERFWGDIPFCIVKATLNGREIEMHLTDGDSIIKNPG